MASSICSPSLARWCRWFDSTQRDATASSWNQAQPVLFITLRYRPTNRRGGLTNHWRNEMRSKFHSNPLSDNTNPSTTKRGPGRFHKAGHKKNSPVASKGAPFGFVVHTNPEKNARRMDKKIFGARQLRKQDALFRQERQMLQSAA